MLVFTGIAGARERRIRASGPQRLNNPVAKHSYMEVVQDMVTTPSTHDTLTQTAVPKDQASAPDSASAGPTSTVTSEVGRLVDGRFRIARLQKFVADSSRREMVVSNTALSQEDVNRGLGTSGIFTVVQPPDLALYRSYIPDPLKMPEVPEVALALVDFNRGNPVTRYPEGWVFVKATRPDNGKDLWVVVSMPVANVLTAYIGLAWGLPKYIADEMTVSHNRAEVIYEGAVRFSLELTPGSVRDEPALRARIGGINQIGMFQPHPGKNQLVPVHQYGRGAQRQTAEWVPGAVKAYLSPDDPWAGLVPAHSESPGVYQRIVDTGRGESVWQTVGSSAAAK